MRVLVTGATGFVASQIVSDLILRGDDVLCCVRDKNYAAEKIPGAKIIQCDFEETDEKFWRKHLKNVDAVINCAGILRSFSKNKIWTIHFSTPKIIFTIAQELKIKKLIQISALGVEVGDTEFAKSKKALDDYLIEKKIPCFIVRPSLVYATGSFGGTSLIRALSAFPRILFLPGRGNQQFQPIYIKDVSKSILQLLENENKNTEIVNVVGPEKISFKNILLEYRRWLGYKRAKIVYVPSKIITIFAALFDFLKSPTLNSTSLKMMSVNNIATESEQKIFFEKINFIPRKFSHVLVANPSYVQDRWHAKLYFLRPLLRYSIAFVWLASAAASLFFPVEKNLEMLSEIGIAKNVQPFVFYGLVFLDFSLGFLTLIHFKIKKVGMLQCAIIFIYSLVIAKYLPQWWAHPFGPMIKNIPLFVAILIMMALESDR